MLKEIKLKNFRNFENINIDFGHNINIIYGENGSGKTNLLESIFFLFNLKSFQTKYKKKIINFNHEYANISGLFFNNNCVDLKFNIYNESRYLFNKILLNKNDDFLLFKKNINIIKFIPKDLDIVYDYPSSRRKYIDYNLIQFKENYLQGLRKYQKYLLIKNKLLKTLKTSNKFSGISNILNIKISILSSKIINIRKNYINTINEYIVKIQNKLGLGIAFDFKLFYQNSTLSSNISNNISELEKKIYDTIKLFNEKEILYGQSLVGAHKDDIVFLLNNKNIKYFASRGQIKICILLLQLAHYEFLKKNDDSKYNILILDDVFNEIDDEKHRLILKYLENYNQVFISYCNKIYIENIFNKSDNSKIKYINIDNKNIVIN